jgi:hypothetical protein
MNALLAAFAGALVGLAGAYITFLFNRRAEKRKLAVEYRQRQIKELYGPLDSLINQTLILKMIMDRMICTDEEGKEEVPENYIIDCEYHPENLTGKRREIWEYFSNKHFLPKNEEMRDLILKNHHLLSTYDLPESFQKFLKHQAQFEARRDLEETNIKVTEKQVEKNPWEGEFNIEVGRTLWELKDSVEIALGLRSRPGKSRHRRFEREEHSRRLLLEKVSPPSHRPGAVK